MIISRITGGLGNQMFQYAIARSIAKRREDIFKLDISFYPKQTLRKYELNCFAIEEHIATQEEIHSFAGKENFLYKMKKRFGFSVHRPSSYYQEKMISVYDEEVFDYSDNIYLDGYWQNEKYFKDIKIELLKEFTLKESISDKAAEYLHTIKETKSVSIHIRRGDYINNLHTNSVHGVCGLDYYQKAIEYFNSKIQDITYFIFSDDIVWCKENLGFIQNKVFVENSQSALEDFELMKGCSHNIVANSTFSWWAAWLNDNSDKIVIAPKQWFADQTLENQAKDLVPVDWLRV